MDSQMADPQVRHSLDAIQKEISSPQLSVERLRALVRDLLVFLASRKGRTDANCRAVDFELMNNDGLWERIDSIEAEDPVLADVLGDMARALHDTVSAPNVAGNFDSTPEQLLERLGP